MKNLKLILVIMFSMLSLVFVGCKNKNLATLSTPTILEIKGGNIVFDQISGADHYTISINEQEVLINVNYNSHIKIIDGKINYNASKIFVVGDSYSVKIKALGAGKHDSDFSEPVSYKHYGNISKPENVKTNGSTLTWDSVQNASYYKVKIITPDNQVVCDYSGNVLTNDDSTSISNANLEEFLFNDNQFNFSSILNHAGTYKFYVCAVLSDGMNYVESGYSPKVTYFNVLTLNTPNLVEVYNSNDELHMITEIDPRANSISIACNNIKKASPLNGSNESISNFDNNINVLDINLNQYFLDEITLGLLNFDSLNQFVFTSQSTNIAASENKLYNDSNQSLEFVHNQRKVLTAPTPTISNNNTTVSWTRPQNETVGEYHVVVAKQNSVETYKLDSDIFSMVLPNDAIAVAVQAIGVGNYLTSELSRFVSLNSGNLSNLNIRENDGVLSWYDSGDYYIVSYGDFYEKVDLANYEIDYSKITSKKTKLTITAIKNGSATKHETFTVQHNPVLTTPVGDNNSSLVGTKPYELSFNAVENAIGYYVYIRKNSSDDSEEAFERIEKLYTSPSINLTQYVLDKAENVDYEVKVQAVASPNSIYKESELSEISKISYINVLDKPKFYKVNDTTKAIDKQISSNGDVQYILKFYGVEDASKYEIYINYNRIVKDAVAEIGTGLYKINVTNYMKSANLYEIKVRAIPNSQNIGSSEYNLWSYSLTKQLDIVKNVSVVEENNVYTLKFDTVNDANIYQIRVVKENDNYYLDHLESLGLSNVFTTKQNNIVVTDYIGESGVYYFYVTAIPSEENTFYVKSQEATITQPVDKLTSLPKPGKFTFNNSSKDEYIVSWPTVDNADYYLVKITDPNLTTYELTPTSASANINQYITIQGQYSVSISSMVRLGSNSSIDYESSDASTEEFVYTLTHEHDFLRSTISLYEQNNINHLIEDFKQLKNVLWYYYLYPIDTNNKPRIMLKSDNLETTITDFANKAESDHIYDFEADSDWNNLKEQKERFDYLCQKVIMAYPEFNVLNYTNSTLVEGMENVFELNYYNELKSFDSYEAIATESGTILKAGNNYSVKTMPNYGNNFKYIDSFLRKSSTGVFNIDSRPQARVSTSEQLIHIVQQGKKPLFVDNSSETEKLYSNAKLVLSTIISNKMTDMEKVTAIFNWLEYGFDLTYYTHTVGNTTYLSNSIGLEDNNVENFGKYKNYYLEGIFENIEIDENANLIIGSNLATSKSYSKAFALLCAIEGIEAKVIHGIYNEKLNHTWNKVKIDGNWYNVDLSLSDNKVDFSNPSNGYGISAHTHFLVDDDFLNTHEDKSILYQTEISCENYYNYYANSRFGLDNNQFDGVISDYKIEGVEDYSFNYSQYFDTNISYQAYNGYNGGKTITAFMMNALIYAKYLLNENNSGYATFEVSYNYLNGYTNEGFNADSGLESKTPLNYALTYAKNNFSISVESYNVFIVKNTSKYTTTVIFTIKAV